MQDVPVDAQRLRGTAKDERARHAGRGIPVSRRDGEEGPVRAQQHTDRICEGADRDAGSRALEPQLDAVRVSGLTTYLGR